MAVASRAQALQELGERRFDVLVIGGGIVGAGIAAAASAHGLAVALVDRGDFAGATSSASSKLVHGGLRYLRLGDVGLVREAHHERRALMQVVAPQLVHRQPFLFPLYEDGPYRPWVVQSGILLYSTLARARLNGLVDTKRASRLVPDLRAAGLRSCAFYADAWTNDARLTIANLRSAHETGATVANYAEVTAIRGGEGAEIVADGHAIAVSARTVVNATGPWVDHVRRLEDPGAARSVRLSKGVHVLVDPGRPWSAALTIPHDKVRVSFAVPWHGMLLLGTTDTLHDGEPSEARVEESDIEQVLAEAAVALEPELVARERVREVYAGLRVLPGGDGATANARRETVYSRGPSGMVSVAGGKLTTYRKIALDALEHLRPDLGLRKLDRTPRPLPGAAGLADVRFPEEIATATRSHLLELYGSLAGEVLAPAEADPSLLEPLRDDAPDLAAQALYACTHEWALTAEDVLRRRTTAWLRGTSEQATERVGRVLDGLHSGAEWLPATHG
ncbi:MAG: glycerol-3-phosphate dehydrogenase/oxidase [Gaiellaceae bacterium]